MNLFRIIGYTAMIFTVLFSSSIYAGAGAVVEVCIHLTTPIQPPPNLTPKERQNWEGYKVTLTPGTSTTSHCMNDYGSSSTFYLKEQGITCGSVGYVESKASSSKGDLCATDKSTWPIAYSYENGTFSGSITTQWNTGNHIKKTSGTSNTYICLSKTNCDSTSQTWSDGTQGPLYVVFNPGASSN